jgi:glyoxylase-like metal-dependent hydrolase (beta-lactamase superfamily II)
VHAIGQREKDPLSGEVLASFPIPLTDNIYFCGFANEATFGAASYLIRRPEGNVLVDVPRFYPKLIQGIEKLGGIRYIFLTHSDDIAGHEEFAKRFGAERIIHANERVSSAMEIRIQENDAVAFAGDLTLIPTPGHTRGSMCLLYKNAVLFSGDHLAGNAKGGLTSFRDACWYSWAEVKKSNERLLNFDFSRVYPGHGRRYHGKDCATTKEALKTYLLGC